MQKNTGSNSQALKQKNKILVLKLIAISKGISRVDIAEITGLSKMTVGNIVTELMEEHLVVERASSGPSTSSGRRPIILSLSPESPCICGMLIKRELCQIILGDLSGNILDEVHYEYTSLKDSKTLIDMLYQGYESLSLRSQRRIIAIGISSLGPLDSFRGILLNPPYFYGIRNLPFASIIGELTKLPVFLVNDASAGALAEKTYGIGQDISNFSYLHIKNGIGSGFILNDILYDGDSGQCGEIGHTSINFAGPQCACGNRGCLELYANADAMRQKIKELKQFYPASPLAKASYPSMEDVISHANLSDTLAMIVLDDFCSYISYALINTLNLLNISTLIVGYDCFKSGTVLENMLQVKLSRSLQFTNCGEIAVKHSFFSGDAPLIGAIAYVADKIFSLQLPL